MPLFRRSPRQVQGVIKPLTINGDKPVGLNSVEERDLLTLMKQAANNDVAAAASTAATTADEPDNGGGPSEAAPTAEEDKDITAAAAPKRGMFSRVKDTTKNAEEAAKLAKTTAIEGKAVVDDINKLMGVVQKNVVKDAMEAAATSKKTAARASQLLTWLHDYLSQWGRGILWLVMSVLVVLGLAATMSALPFSLQKLIEVTDLWANRGDSLSSTRYFLLQSDDRGGSLIECRASVKRWDRLISDLAGCAGHADGRAVRELRRIRAKHSPDGEVSCPNGRKTMIREKSFYPLSNAFPPQPGLERQNWCIEIVF